MPDEPVNDQNANAQDDLAVKIEEAVKKDEAQVKIEELTAALQRCMADLQNFKRRSEEEKFKFVRFANAELLKTLIPVFLHFDRAAKQIPESLKEDAWGKGVLSVYEEFSKTLEKIGVARMETVGKPLNPLLHEALMTGAGEKDVILEELEPGFLLNEETLKTAKVKVGNGES